jgi:integrative and conjugative element protein (TIGR02256 family)
VIQAQGDVEFSSGNGRFGLRLPHELVERMRLLCAKAGRRETGGILVGYYTEDLRTAVVTEVTAAPADSTAGFTRFYRGVRGLHAYLLRLWTRRRHYYLGEWHFHPFAAPIPSGTDRLQMREIAGTPSYHCPEPILVILGGNPKGDWHLSAHVFVRDGESSELVRPQVDDPSPASPAAAPPSEVIE